MFWATGFTSAAFAATPAGIYPPGWRPRYHGTMSELQDDDLIKGWPEFGELDGKRVRLTRVFVKSLTPSQKVELIIGEGGDRMRPFRFASQGSDYALK